jgi:hypothetical protein
MERRTTLRPISNGIAVTVAAVALAVGIAASAAPAHAALPPNIRCAVAKRKAAVAKLRAINACFGQAAPMTTQPPDPTCLANADRTFQKKFLRIEARGGCLPATDDALDVGRIVNQCEVGLVRFLSGVCLEAGSPCTLATPCCSGLCAGGEIGQVAVCR